MKRDYKNSRLLRLFISFYKPHWRLFAIDIICAFFVALTDLSFPFVSKLSMERLLPQGKYSAFFTVMVIIAVAYVIRAALYYVITYWGHLLGVRIEADMRSEVFSHVQTLSFSFFDKHRTGILMSRITTDLFEITELAHHGPEDLFISVTTFVGAFVILCTIEWRLAVILFAIIPFFILFTVIQRKRMRDANLTVKQRTGEINAAIESGISGMRTAKAFANEESESRKFWYSNEAFKGSKGEYYKTMGVFQSGMEFTMAMMQVVVITVGGYFIMKGRIGYVELITFSLYVTTFVSPVRKLANFIEQYMQGMAGFTRFVQLMRTDPDIQDSPDARELTVTEGTIEYKDVSFQYDPSNTVLDGVSVRIEGGESLAIVGPSGSGKTTFCQLLPRFYDVASGEILIDGQNIKDLTQHSLRQNIGIVQQDVFLFAGTVRDNIRYGRPDATDEEIIAASMKAEIHDEILEMPDGYDSFVGERGVMLSGGQKQRISIARIFLKNPPILILDEATSALDSLTEARIQKALDQLGKGKTRMIVAHRLSTIQDADRIAVIDGERLVETGSHQELLARGGRYTELYNTQSLQNDESLL